MSGSGREIPRASTAVIDYDAAATAPERDRALDAPQVVYASGPETFYNGSPPEAIEPTEKEPWKVADSRPSVSRRLPLRSIVIAAAIIIAILAIAIGVGVGVGLKRRRSSNSSSSPSSNSTEDVGTLPSASVFLDKGILENTSIAALAISDQDRRLYFQDATGHIRQASYSSATNKWIALTDTVIASDAKNHTPIAAINTPDRTTPNLQGKQSPIPGGPTIFYVSANGSLASVQYTESSWVSTIPGFSINDYFGLSHFSAAASPKHLSASVFQTTRSINASYNRTVFNAYLITESPDDSITMLNGSLGASDSLQPAWLWSNVTDKLMLSRPYPDVQFGAPFVTVSDNAQGEVQILSCNMDDHGTFTGNLLSSMYSIYDNEIITFQESGDGDYPASILNSDLISLELNTSATLDDKDPWFGFWVDDTPRLSPLKELASVAAMPTSAFPYSRLAGLGSASGTALFVYHQLNASAFMEDNWDNVAGVWTSTPFAVSTS